MIAGERRLRASQIAGLATVPIHAVLGKEKLELALIENIQRQNLNVPEEAFAYRRLIDEFNLTQESCRTSWCSFYYCQSCAFIRFTRNCQKSFGR